MVNGVNSNSLTGLTMADIQRQPNHPGAAAAVNIEYPQDAFEHGDKPKKKGSFLGSVVKWAIGLGASAAALVVAKRNGLLKVPIKIADDALPKVKKALTEIQEKAFTVFKNKNGTHSLTVEEASKEVLTTIKKMDNEQIKHTQIEDAVKVLKESVTDDTAKFSDKIKKYLNIAAEKTEEIWQKLSSKIKNSKA